MAAASPPRKSPKCGGRAQRAPQIVFSPGRRLKADGFTHEASAEVNAFLQNRGYSAEDASRIIAHGARAAEAAPAPRPSDVPLGRRRRCLGDHVRAMGLGSAVAGSSDAEDFEAELGEVLGAPGDSHARGVTSWPSEAIGRGSVLGHLPQPQAVAPPVVERSCVGAGAVGRALSVSVSDTVSTGAPFGDEESDDDLLFAAIRKVEEAVSASQQQQQPEPALGGLADEDSDDEMLFAAVREVEERLATQATQASQASQRAIVCVDIDD